MTAPRGNSNGGFGGDLEIDGFPIGMDDIDPANEPMDRADLRILADLLAIYDTVDPMPEMLPDLVLF